MAWTWLKIAMVWMWLKSVYCRVVGHDWPMSFHEKGVFWCISCGGYDCVCRRCGARWENTPKGAEALARSRLRDPREKEETDPT